MQRRNFIKTISVIGTVVLAGCTANRVGDDSDGDPENGEQTVTRSDAGVVVKNLEVWSEGERDCYHEIDATVMNTNDYTVEDVEIEITILSEDDQYLSQFTTGYVSISPGESKPMEVESGPQQNECWHSYDAADYDISVTIG